MPTSRPCLAAGQPHLEVAAASCLSVARPPQDDLLMSYHLAAVLIMQILTRRTLLIRWSALHKI